MISFFIVIQENFEYIKGHYDSTYPESIAELQNRGIENVKTFRYFGDEIKFDGPSTGTAEINLCISLAEAKFYELKNKITNHKIVNRVDKSIDIQLNGSQWTDLKPNMEYKHCRDEHN